MQNINWHYVDPVTALPLDIAGKICDLANTCIREKGRFAIVLAGGNTPRDIYAQMQTCDTDWKHWQIYFSDERCLPAGAPGRNDSMAREALLDHIAIPHDNIHAIPAQLPTTRCIADYTQTLDAVGQFDLVLLGLGEDGHTASLFPDHPWGSEKDSPVIMAVSDAPKPPPQRISLSAARLGNAMHVWFVITGKNKLDALKRWQAGEKIPASAICPTGKIEVFIAI